MSFTLVDPLDPSGHIKSLGSKKKSDQNQNLSVN